MSKLICEEVINGETVIRSYTTPSVDAAAAFAKLHPGVGNAFWCWPTVPAGTIIAVDFTNAPLATSSTAGNKALIEAITAQPGDVLTYET